MNSVVLIGRLARDPEVRYTQDQMAIARFTVAVDRRMSRQGGGQDEQTADFPGCVAFGKTAEFIEKYFSKGKLIGIQGHIRTGSYTNKDGQKVYTTDVVCDNVEFVGSKSESGGDSSRGNYGGGYERSERQAAPARQADSAIPDGFEALEDDDIPF